ANDNFAPAPYSFQIDKGGPIQGINTRNKTGGRLYVGFPDAGAIEGGTIPGGPPPPPPPPGGGGHQFAIFPMHPNPARGGAVVHLVVPEKTRVDAAVFDVAGRQVSTLADAQVMSAGEHDLVWTGKKDDGTRAMAGMYFIRIRTALGGSVQRIVMMN